MADFHLSYAADPAASSRLGSAVWIAGAQAVEHLDLKLASSVLDLQLADCEAARRALLPADCSALAEADFRAQRKADRYVAELPAPHSALADWPPVDCLVRDDLARGDCSGSAPVGWDDCRVRLMVDDRYVLELPAPHSALADWLLADCLVLNDLARGDCSGSAPAGWDDCPALLMVVDRCAVVLVAVYSASDDSVPAGCWD